MLNRNKRGIARQSQASAGSRDPAAPGAGRRRADRRTTAAARSRSSASATTCWRQANPGLIYCAVSGYGRDGPLRGQGRLRPDRAGLRRLDVDHRRARTGRRSRHGNPVADINAGSLAVDRHRSPRTRTSCKTGSGQIVDTSLAGGGAAADLLACRDPFRDGRVARAERLGASADRALPGVSRERRLDQHRRRQPGELGAHRRRAGPSRVARRSALRDQLGAHAESRRARVAAMDAVLGTRTKAEWIAAFDAAGVPVGPVHSIGEALAHPQTLARGMVVDLVHPEAGPTKRSRLPDPLFSATPTRDHAPGAACSASTRARCCANGFSDADVDALTQIGVCRRDAEQSAAE